MFTGLINAVGTLQPYGTEQLRIICLPEQAHLLLPELEIGDSVAVDGVCLTVTQILPQGFLADASPETLSRSTLGLISEPETVNLEPALKLGSKLGGHFVTGHVDGIGSLQEVVEIDGSWEMSFSATLSIARYIVHKGSIAVNGVSLTVADCNSAGTWFKVAVIPHTYGKTTLHRLQPGSRVNLEGDILGKYVEKFLRLGDDRAAGQPPQIREEDGPFESIGPAFLTEHGYL
ncbi:riboflavin synthase subunit alpha [Leptolyngbya sp. 'hensonii']|uniref:riboflavin synthase n=1 Tax=Leptolyngbya sp. 'hensonii' TaxID=1922337 RepID=UPI00094F5DFC|nr:riboflavin synthase [Leptolyngbya sp. 'hensonii']OLP17793.1 riboflavin synthase subunit alpha [Leptolyngbya sp. 'hensonii']